MRVDLLLASDLIALTLLSGLLVHLFQLVLLLGGLPVPTVRKDKKQTPGDA